MLHIAIVQNYTGQWKQMCNFFIVVLVSESWLIIGAALKFVLETDPEKFFSHGRTRLCY